jgi:hypothetical protein
LTLQTSRFTIPKENNIWWRIVMAYSGGSAGASAAYSAMVQAVKASGAIVQVEPDAFLTVVSKMAEPLIVISVGGIFKKDFRYLTSYKGLIFYTKSHSQLILPGRTELIAAKQIWVPS